MSASRRCSTAWSAGAWRWSTTSPGVTRDRREGRARLGDLDFTVIDTAGLEEAAPASLTGRMQAQTEAAIAAADAVLFLIDARAGSTPADRAFADLVRRSGKPAIVVANKSEGRAGAGGVLEAYELGLGEPVAISAEHGEGLADLYDALRAALPERPRPWRSRTPTTKATPKSRRAAADPHRGGRPAEFRQVDADQPAARRGAAADRPRSRHHPRRHRGRRRRGRAAASAFTTPPACAAAPGSRRSSKSSRSPTRSTPSASPRW